MKNRPWEAIHEIYTRMEKLCGRSLYLAEESLFADEEEPEGVIPAGTEGGDKSPTTEDLIHIRAELRNQLDFLKAVLAEHYSEKDTYLVLFAVVAQIDELIQNNYLHAMNTSWPLLQRELFQIENAGEVFFEILDDILPKPQTSLFLYQVYLFCIRYGFRGRYENNQVKISEYIKKLQSKLGQEEIVRPPVESEETLRPRRWSSPYWYYAIIIGVLVFTYFVFNWWPSPQLTTINLSGLIVK
jgi:type IV/VI secretion system ImpK/VasF family protein